MVHVRKGLLNGIELPEQREQASFAHGLDDQAIPLLAQNGLIPVQFEFARNPQGLIPAVAKQPHMAFSFIHDGDSKAYAKAYACQRLASTYPDALTDR